MEPAFAQVPKNCQQSVEYTVVNKARNRSFIYYLPISSRYSNVEILMFASEQSQPVRTRRANQCSQFLPDLGRLHTEALLDYS